MQEFLTSPSARRRRRAAATLLLGLATALPTGWAQTGMARVRCLGCHSGVSRVFVDPETGERHDVALNMVDFYAGEHGEVPCLECHVEGFTTFPHFEKKSLPCMECHPREDAEPREREAYDFERIEDEFEASVHYTEHPEEFDCHACHDPHYFQVATEFESPTRLIDYHNRICTDCHASGAERPLADPAEPSLAAEHAWLPHVQPHLAATRCIDCHTDVGRVASHDLPEQADRGCLTCHSRKPPVLDTLFRHYLDRPHGREGFTNAAMLRVGYVMGATRPVLLDVAAYLLVGGAVLFVIVHGGVRLARRLRGRSR